jgi:hypothetical protein
MLLVVAIKVSIFIDGYEGVGHVLYVFRREYCARLLAAISSSKAMSGL